MEPVFYSLAVKTGSTEKGRSPLDFTQRYATARSTQGHQLHPRKFVNLGEALDDDPNQFKKITETSQKQRLQAYAAETQHK